MRVKKRTKHIEPDEMSLGPSPAWRHKIMSSGMRCFVLWLGCVFWFSAPLKINAFSLIGPVQPWMQASNGIIEPGNIGGPMSISNGYRWNVPVVTFGFDQSFLDYFGSNGVAAVESAIQIINDLPPVSDLVLTNYPFDSTLQNYQAQALNLVDLKSTTLSLLLAHLGLAPPEYNIYVLDGWNPALFNYQTGPFEGFVYLIISAGEEWDSYNMDPGENVFNFIINRNYDPSTLNASIYVNGESYGCEVYSTSGQNSVNPYPIDPLAPSFAAAANFILNLNPVGKFYTGLTYDDVGGLAFLLSTNNINYETLIPGVAGAGTNLNSFVNGAWRPGVDKITFVPQPVDPQSGAFLSMTNYFTDRYLTNGCLKQQQMARIILQPDFLFSGGNVTPATTLFSSWTCTGSSNWVNNAAANGATNGAGPGVIQPPVQLVFNKLGRQLYSAANPYYPELQIFDISTYLASYGDSTNQPFIYPIPQSGTNQMSFLLSLLPADGTQKSILWQTASVVGQQFSLQTSTNLANWTSLFTVTNNGAVCVYENQNPTSPCRYYRFLPQ